MTGPEGRTGALDFAQPHHRTIAFFPWPCGAELAGVARVPTLRNVPGRCPAEESTSVYMRPRLPAPATCELRFRYWPQLSAQTPYPDLFVSAQRQREFTSLVDSSVRNNGRL